MNTKPGFFPRPAYLPPADYVPLATTHPLEVSVYRQPNGAKFVVLVDDSEATWRAYSADVVAASRHALREREHRRALARATWEDSK